MTSDADRLAGYLDVWDRGVADVLALLQSLDGDDWAKPTDLPGWDVRAVAAHLAHLEAELGGIVDPLPLDREPSLRVSPNYTERGVTARADRTPDELVAELEAGHRAAMEQLRQDPPTDPRATPTTTPGGIGWDNETLLRNRGVDVWVHEQDIRRAVGRPGGMGSPGSAHVARVLASAVPYVVGKRVKPPAGTAVELTVSEAFTLRVAVDESRRARVVEESREPPTVRLEMDPETFLVLGAGRRTPAQVTVKVTGDVALGRAVLASLNVMP